MRSILLTLATMAIPAMAQMQSPPASPASDLATQARDLTATRTLPPPPTPPVATAAQPFLFLAGESDVFEISSSDVALKRSASSEVRRFAQMMIEHHTLTTNQALAAAAAAGVAPPPPVLQADKRDRITRLLAVAPGDFDREYLGQQVSSHEAALALHRTYAERGDTPQLRTVAQGAVPIVTRHLEDARRMLAGVR